MPPNWTSKISFNQKNRRTKQKPAISKHSSKFRIFTKALSRAFFEYCRETKVNGPFYWQRGVTTGFTRFLWIIIPIAVLIVGLVLVFSLWSRYSESPTRMTIGKPVSVAQVPFPAITICHPRTVAEYKIEEFVERIKIPPGVTKQRVQEALPVVGVLIEHQWAAVPKVEDLELVNRVLELNNISVFSAISQLGKTCDDFMIQCQFAGKKFPCFQKHPYLSWSTSTSCNYGVCCSFHYNPTDIDFEPAAANNYGSEGGLSVVLTGFPSSGKGISGNLYSTGLLAIVHHPLDYALNTHPTIYLGIHRETFVAISPIKLTCSDSVLMLPESQRLCIRPEEYVSTESVESYRPAACILACIREEIHKVCDCHPFFLPHELVFGRGKRIRDCTILDGMCVLKNYGRFKTTQCNCLPLCNDVSYTVNHFASQMFSGALNYSVTDLYGVTNQTDQEMVVHFFMAKQTVVTHLRIVVMSWMTLLSNLGGVFSLCLGISMISLIEIFYYLGVRIRVHYLNLLAESQQQINEATKHVLKIIEGRDGN